MLEPIYGDRIGGGIVGYYATPRISHNKITGNEVSSAYAFGGGINIYTESGNYWAIIENNIIIGNQCIAGTGIAAGGGVQITSHARIENNVISNNYCSSSSGDASGGGIHHESMNTPVNTLILKNNMVCNNNLSVGNLARGGGVSVFYSECLISQNTIKMNSLTGNITVGGGLIIFTSSSATVTGNVITYNSVTPLDQYWGVGCMVAFPVGNTTINNNEFSNNLGPKEGYVGLGGGIAIRDAEMNTLSITDNIFRNNTGWFGGGFYSKSSYKLNMMNNLFVDNESYEGGAIGMYIPSSTANAHPLIVNNTFFSNSAIDHAGAIRLNCETNIPILFNNIFYENHAPLAKDIYYIGSEDEIIVAYSDIDTNSIIGPWTGKGNIDEDPVFIDPNMNNYSLDSCYSPCVGKGIASLYIENFGWFLAPDHDILGRIRPMPSGHQPDMGAYEVDSCYINEIVKFQVSNFKFQVYPNPSFGLSEITYQLTGYRISATGYHLVKLSVFDIRGNEIRTLVDEKQGVGEYVVRFDGSELPAGIYFIRLQVGDLEEIAKMILIPG